MSLAQTLATAVAGMRVTQAGMTLVAGNVTNAETPGYVRKTLVQTTTAAGDFGVSVRTSGINRELDQYLQRQFRIESSGGAYANLRSQFYERLQRIYGDPGATGGLESAYNNFITALQALSTSPDDYSARAGVLSQAQVLANQLNGMTDDIQALRSSAEIGMADSVARANEAMQQIARLNQQLATASTSDTASATLMDQRDRYIDELAQLMDIRVVAGDFNQVNVFTSSGIQLVGTVASELAFDAKGEMTPNALWTVDPALRGVGTISVVSKTGGNLDLVAMKAIRSGELAAFLEMRDDILVQAQSQLDEIASAMSRALSDVSTAGTAVTNGPQAGFDIDTAGLVAGNTIRIDYTDNGAQKYITVVRVDDPSVLPLPPTATTDPNDDVIGFDFTQGVAALAGLLSGKYAGKLQFSNPSGTMLRVLDDGTLNKTDITSATATRTVTSLNGGAAALPFFTDGERVFSSAITAVGPTTRGLAGRIAVNSNLLSDPALLVHYQSGVAEGDATRPNYIYDRLTTGVMDFAPNSGIGTVTAPFSGSLPSFMRQVLSQQGAAAEGASQLQQGQEVVVNAFRQRLSETAGVNIDREMAQLLELQSAYSANARILGAVKEMLETLMRI